MKKQRKAVIIGAGVAGLAAAIRLAVQGFSVTVYERNAVPGGKLGYFEQSGYHFDTGPSLFTQPEQIEALFELAQEEIGSFFRYRKMPYSCHYFYEDGTTIYASADSNIFEKELTAKNGEKEGSLQQYLKRSGKLYDAIGQLFLNHSLHKTATFFKIPFGKIVNAINWRDLFGTLHQANQSGFRSEKTVQLFNRYATYNGSNPYQAPGMLRLIPHLEHNQGTFYPEGGMISITNALYALALKKGVQFQFNTPVERIIHCGNKVKGVVVKGINHYADVVVSNVDIYFTYKQLLNNDLLAAKVLKQERSSSAMIFYWGIKKAFSVLGLHNIFFASNYREEFDHLFKQKKAYHDPTVYINITAKCEQGLQAPAGKENWFVMVNVPANVGQNWEAYRIHYRAAILAKLNRLLGEDIAPLIETETVLDPVGIEANTASYQGSLYGTSSNSRMAAFLRHPNFTRSIKGLYFVGGSVHPGGGIPLCLKSAAIMSNLVAAENQ